MPYKFRLTFRCASPDLFNFEEESVEVPVGEDRSFSLVARDADTLAEATNFHFEGKGFASEEDAKETGERLRLRLRVLNSLLNLGLTVPAEDTTSAKASASMKERIKRETGAILLDTIVGLATFPDDERYVEHIISGNIDVEPSDPSYVFKALSKVWDTDISLDQRGEDALDILSRSTAKGSPRVRFLLTYLALERLIERPPREGEARELVDSFRETVKESGLDQKSKNSLYGALSNLREQSFRTALMDFADKIEDPQQLMGKPLKDFLSDCVSIRNRIVHNADLDPDTNLNQIANELRLFVLKTIWTFNNLPEVSVDIPASKVSIPTGGLSIRMK